MKLTRIITVLALVLAVAACRHGGANRATRILVDPELLKMSKEQVYQKGEEQFAKRKWQRARTYYSHVYETYPNDPLGRRSLLRVADTFYEQGDPVNLVEAQYKYRDFINRYPSSEQADYAMLQMAMTAFKQMESPDRDQQKTREAVEKINDMIKAYPRSPLRAEADQRLREANDRLAKHEHMIARYYMRRGSNTSAVQRLNYLIDTFPNYAERDGAFFDLGQSLSSLGRNGEARLYFERVVTEFPKSNYAERARVRLEQTKA